MFTMPVATSSMHPISLSALREDTILQSAAAHSDLLAKVSPVAHEHAAPSLQDVNGREELNPQGMGVPRAPSEAHIQPTYLHTHQTSHQASQSMQTHAIQFPMHMNAYLNQSAGLPLPGHHYGGLTGYTTQLMSLIEQQKQLLACQLQAIFGPCSNTTCGLDTHSRMCMPEALGGVAQYAAVAPGAAAPQAYVPQASAWMQQVLAQGTGPALNAAMASCAGAQASVAGAGAALQGGAVAQATAPLGIPAGGATATGRPLEAEVDPCAATACLLAPVPLLPAGKVVVHRVSGGW